MSPWCPVTCGETEAGLGGHWPQLRSLATGSNVALIKPTEKRRALRELGEQAKAAGPRGQPASRNRREDSSCADSVGLADLEALGKHTHLLAGQHLPQSPGRESMATRHGTPRTAGPPQHPHTEQPQEANLGTSPGEEGKHQVFQSFPPVE